MLSVIAITPIPPAQDELSTTPAAKDNTEISPYNYTYEWVYQAVNGKTYKRLFNKTTGEWASDWIEV